MQYKGLEITAFEQSPGKWRARIVRANGRPLEANNRQLLEPVTSANLPSAVDVLTLALEAVDAAGFFLAMPTGERNDFGECYFGLVSLVAAARIGSPRESADGDVCRGKLVSLTSGRPAKPVSPWI
jgi:hypothetical protein